MALGGSDRDMKDALSKLLQIGTVAEYQNEFEILINRVTGISQSLTSFFISGLKLELQRELWRSRPTTLKEAFSLARIAEARYEDEQATIAIAKPNDLTAKVLYQVFFPHEYVEKVVIFYKSSRVQALIQFQSHQNAIAAINSLQGRNIYEGCCQLDIQFTNLEELQPNQDDHICYYYWGNFFSILNANEADNTKPPLPVDTFGSNGGDDLETSGPVTPAEEVVDSGHTDASASYGDRSSVPEGRRITGGSLVGMDVGLSYALGSGRSKKKKVEVLRPRKRKAEEEKGG
ncbi:polypyrimidine tract-binding protein homolog 3 [Tanacetum coccineum]